MTTETRVVELRRMARDRMAARLRELGERLLDGVWERCDNVDEHAIIAEELREIIADVERGRP